MSSVTESTRARDAEGGARTAEQEAGRRFVARMLQHHGVAALTWRGGEVTWANEVALDLVSDEERDEAGVDLLSRLSHAFAAPAELSELAPREERVVDVNLASNRALLRLSAMAARTGEDDGEPTVLVTFRAPLEASVDPAHVARLQAMLDSTSDIITVIDREGRIRVSNPAAGRITGFVGAEANGLSMVEFVHPEDVPEVLDAFNRGVLNGEDVEPFIVRIRMADGEWHHTEIALADQVEIDGDAAHVVSVRDVTDRVRRDAESEQHRRRLESLVENIDDVLVILGPDLSVQWTSPGIERFVDAPAYTNVGENAFNDMHPEDVEGVLAAITAAMEAPDGRSKAFFRLRHARFGWRSVDASVVNRLDDPAVEGLVCTLRDVTDEAGSEDARKRAGEREEMVRLREADRLKDRFLATVSHELRTPLTSVRGFSSVLQSQWDDLTPENRIQLVDRIAANAVAMERMIEQLLEFSRLQAGRVQVEPEPLDLDEAVAEMLESLAHHLGEHEVVATMRGLRVLGDRNAFGHVLRNLLTNAARYSSAGTRIEIDAEADGDEVHIRVIDQGIGIAEEDQSRVFQSFFQSAPAATAQRGTGVGLNVARRYAQLQSGRLDLHSVLGEGSTFTFTLPAA